MTEWLQINMRMHLRMRVCFAEVAGQAEVASICHSMRTRKKVRPKFILGGTKMVMLIFGFNIAAKFFFIRRQ